MTAVTFSREQEIEDSELLFSGCPLILIQVKGGRLEAQWPTGTLRATILSAVIGSTSRWDGLIVARRARRRARCRASGSRRRCPSSGPDRPLEADRAIARERRRCRMRPAETPAHRGGRVTSAILPGRYRAMPRDRRLRA